MSDSRAALLPPTLALGPLSPVLRPETGEPGVARILVVDHEATTREALALFLRERGHDVHVCGSGPAALALLGHERFDVILCDVRMPGMSGLEVVPRALAIDSDLAVLMLAAANEPGAVMEALSHGALEYLVKPAVFADLPGAVERAVHRRRLERERTALNALAVGIAETLIDAMEAKDVYLRGHSRRVAELSAAVAEELGFNADAVEHVRLAGRLHDVGVIGIREDVLNKPGALTDEEYAHVQEHVRIGMEVLGPLRHIPEALEFIHDHHERFDGAGYPRGKAGTDISIGGRILAACDAFDAMRSRRAYREAFDQKQTFEQLQAEVGRSLDPSVFAALEKVVGR